MTEPLRSGETTETPLAGRGKALPDGTFIDENGVRRSRSGAVLGHPEMEAPAYGLTPGDAVDEREVRGVRAPDAPR